MLPARSFGPEPRPHRTSFLLSTVMYSSCCFSDSDIVLGRSGDGDYDYEQALLLLLLISPVYDTAQSSKRMRGLSDFV